MGSEFVAQLKLATLYDCLWISWTSSRPRHATQDQAYQIYTGGFATALASHSPEEDYSKPYMLAALPVVSAGGS